MKVEILTIETTKKIASLEKANKKLQKKIDKAIEMIEQNEWYTKLRKTFINNLLKVLKGVNNE